MPRIGYAPGAFDLFHIGHLNLLREARAHCDFLIAGVASDAVLMRQKGIRPVVPLAERLAIVASNRYVDQAYAATTSDKIEIWRELRFDVLFKGDDWRGTEMGRRLESDFAPLGVEVLYFPYTSSISSTALRRTLHNINALAEGSSRAQCTGHPWIPAIVGAEGQNRVALPTVLDFDLTARPGVSGQRPSTTNG